MKTAAALLLALGLAVAWRTGFGARFDAWLETHRMPRLVVPPGWPAPRYDFADNPVTPAGFALGRALFYDPQLSRDGSIACANCHQQFAAFAHYDHRVSHGIGGVDGKRNAPALFNLAWQPDFMWDGAVHSLELQPLAPLANPIEMGETLPGVLAKLRADPAYPPRFAAAFGTPEIDSQRMLRALTQFIGTLQATHARYDTVMAGEASFTAPEQRGLAVFRAQCASCHREPLFTDFSYRNNGLDREPRDAGREVISGRAEDHGRFRVPSLRNVALTAPYMHDGRFATLDEVLDHYASHIEESPTLDPQLRKGITLDAADRAALLQFLATLNDERLLADRRYAEPGNEP
ncbi:MAG: cytochrome-c peroxidase [Solimonas sp.]